MNQNMLPRSDDGNSEMQMAVNRSMAKPTLRMPALSSDAQEYESALTNDIHEAQRQQQRIQDVI